MSGSQGHTLAQFILVLSALSPKSSQMWSSESDEGSMKGLSDRHMSHQKGRELKEILQNSSQPLCVNAHTGHTAHCAVPPSTDFRERPTAEKATFCTKPRSFLSRSLLQWDGSFQCQAHSCLCLCLAYTGPTAKRKDWLCGRAGTGNLPVTS